MTLGATAVFSYAWLVPGALYAFLWWTNTNTGGISNLSFLDLICLYGYSLVIYIPVSVLWLIQISAIQWILVLVAAGLSGAVISITLWPVLKENSSKASTILMIVILGLHLLLACGFMLYFFHVPGGSGSTVAAVDAGVKVEGSDPAEGTKTSDSKEKREGKLENEGETKEESKQEEEDGKEKEALKPLAQKVETPAKPAEAKPAEAKPAEANATNPAKKVRRNTRG